MLDDFFFFPTQSDNPMANARWWFLMSSQQKVQHLTDSEEITAKQIKLILRIYGEEETIKEED